MFSNAITDEAEAGRHGIGEALDRHLKARPADLLVMGAYGHSRLREFVLGGATRSVLSRQVVPVMLSDRALVVGLVDPSDVRLFPRSSFRAEVRTHSYWAP